MKIVHVLVPLVAIGLAGCHSTTGGGTSSSPTTTSRSAVAEISKSQLEGDLKQAIKAKTDTVMSTVSCKGPLEGKVGATQYCVATAEKDGTSAGVRVTTTSLKSDGIDYDLEFVPVEPS